MDSESMLLSQLSNLHTRLTSMSSDKLLSNIDISISSLPMRVIVVSTKLNSSTAFQSVINELQKLSTVTLTEIDVPMTKEASEFITLSLHPVFSSSTSIASIESNSFSFDKTVAMNAGAADAVSSLVISSSTADASVIIIVFGISLMIIPHLLRSRLKNATIAFVLDSPFPNVEFFRTVPRRTELLTGLLNGSNVVITGDEKYVVNIKESATLLLGIDTSNGFIKFDASSVQCKIVSMPLLDNSCKTSTQVEKDFMLREIGKGLSDEKRMKLKLIVAVDDAVDFTRCILLKFLAIEDLLETHADLREILIFIYLLPLEKVESPSLLDLIDKISQTVGEINGRFATPTWSPILLLRSPLSQEKKIALFSIAQVGLFTSLRDVVPQGISEFTSAHEASESPGVAIVSEFCGSSANLTSAILVNPIDTRSTAKAVYQAIACGNEERQIRHKSLSFWMQQCCASSWTSRILDAIKIAQDIELKQRQLTKLDTEHVLAAYTGCQKRFIFIDGFENIQQQHRGGDELGSPSASIRSSLIQLCIDPANTVWLSTNGLSTAIIDAWFGDIPIGLASEDGVKLRWPPAPDKQVEQAVLKKSEEENGSARPENEHLQRHNDLLASFSNRNTISTWEPCLGKSNGSDTAVETSYIVWMEETVDIMRYFTERTPGSSLNVLDCSAVFSWAATASDFGELQARDLLLHLNSMLLSTPAHARLSQAKKTITVSLKSTSKGLLIQYLLKSYEERQKTGDTTVPFFDFFLGISVDNVIASHFPPARAFSVAVGRASATGAKYILDSPEQAATLLFSLGVSKQIKNHI
jgi:trehalose-6-phosphate synthase/trehalose-6-phosphatase